MLLLLISAATCTSSIAQETAHTTVSIRSGQPQLVTVERIGDVAVVQGDMIVGNADNYFGRKQTRGLSNTVYGATWPNGIVPYVIDDGLSNTAANRIREAIQHWNNVQVVYLVERTNANASAFPNYIHFINQNQCASWVGFQNTGPQSVYSGDNCSTGSMIHEIGHALGLLHEHTRPDRDNFVAVNWRNISSGKEHNFEILSDGLPLGDYDYGSIMHYGERFFSANGSPTLQPLTSISTTIGQREAASQGDIESMALLYRTNLSLVIQSVEDNVDAGASTPVTLYVTNQTDVGANTLAINVPVPQGTNLVSYTSGQWLCRQDQTGADINCQSVALSGGADSEVSLLLQFPGSAGSTTLNASLSSLTDDFDNSDNSDFATLNVVGTAGTTFTSTDDQTTPQISAANTNTAAPKIAAAGGGNSGGGGSMHIIALLMLSLWSAARRFHTAMHSKRALLDT
jgi:astacin